jgi:hypothetical protein
MYRVRSRFPLVLAILLVAAAVISIHRANTVGEVRPYADLCGISAVRVQVVDLLQILKPATLPEGGLTSAVSSYLQGHHVPVAPSTNESAPVLWFQVSGLPLEGQYSVVVTAGLQEACSVGRRPGKSMKYCQTWQIGPHLALIPRGQETQLVREVNAVVEQFVDAFERTKLVCSKE